MKKIFILFFFVFILSSCFGNQDNGLINYDKNDNFTIKIPNSWSIIEDTEKVLPKPKSGDIELAITSKNEKNGFLNNLVILSEEQKNNISITDYIDINTNNKNNNYFEYEEIENKNFKFENGDLSKIITFNARYNDKTPKLKFLQTANYCGNKIYFITLAIQKDVFDISKYKNILSSFYCKK